jgi:hypothetical protein
MVIPIHGGMWESKNAHELLHIIHCNQDIELRQNLPEEQRNTLRESDIAENLSSLRVNRTRNVSVIRSAVPPPAKIIAV